MKVQRLEADVMYPAEFIQRLGRSAARYREMRAAGKFRHLENPGVSEAVGYTVYNRRLALAWFSDGGAKARPERGRVLTIKRPASARGPKRLQKVG